MRIEDILFVKYTFPIAIVGLCALLFVMMMAFAHLLLYLDEKRTIRKRKVKEQEEEQYKENKI